MARDPQKARERQRRYRERKKIAKYGPEASGMDMRGRHGNHPRGDANGRSGPSRRLTAHGYVAVRVPVDHPHAWGPSGLKSHRYAYEHVCVAMGHLGRPLREEEVVHHRNGDRTDNRWENLEVMTRSAHAIEHSAFPGSRDDLGRFAPGPRSAHPPEDLRVREFPS